MYIITIAIIVLCAAIKYIMYTNGGLCIKFGGGGVNDERLQQREKVPGFKYSDCIPRGPPDMNNGGFR